MTEVGVWLILALTMMSNLHMPVWLLKIANHTEGRGQVAIHSKDFASICDAIQLEARKKTFFSYLKRFFNRFSYLKSVFFL